MDERSTYDDDIFAWSCEQAAVLRALTSRRDLPNQLDLEHVAEEIEDLGKSQLNAARSFARLIFGHLIKIASVPDGPPSAAWRKEIRVFMADFREHFSPSMTQRFDLATVWENAILKADADLSAREEPMMEGLATACPFRLDDLLTGRPDVDALLARLVADPG